MPAPYLLIIQWGNRLMCACLSVLYTLLSISVLESTPQREFLDVDSLHCFQTLKLKNAEKKPHRSDRAHFPRILQSPWTPDYPLHGFSHPVHINLGWRCHHCDHHPHWSSPPHSYVPLPKNAGQLRDCVHTLMYLFPRMLASSETMYTLVTIPQMLSELVAQNQLISLAGCTIQIFFLLTLAINNCFLLMGKGYDHHVAICNPLRYTLTMSNRVCIQLMSGDCSIGLAMAAVQYPYLLNPFITGWLVISSVTLSLS